MSPQPEVSPPELLRRRSTDVAAAVLRTLVAAASGARELLEREAELDWDEHYPDDTEGSVDPGHAEDTVDPVAPNGPAAGPVTTPPWGGTAVWSGGRR